MHKKIPYQYTFSDIEKYLKGELSHTDMHAMEKAALQDPFLADAIEGYQKADLTTTSIHLNEIRNSLLNEKNETKIVSLFAKNNTWFKVAAIFILIAGISWFVINMGAQKQPEIAQQKPIDTNNKKIDSSDDLVKKPPEITGKEEIVASLNKKNSPHTDKPSLLSDKKDVESVLSEKISTEVNTLSDLSTINKGTSTLAAATINPFFNKKENLDSNNTLKSSIPLKDVTQNTFQYQQSLQGKVAGVYVQPNMSKNQYTIKGKILNAQQKPLPNASIVLNTKIPKAVVSDREGNFTIKSDDTAATVKISSLGYEPIESKISVSANNLLTLNNETSALNEVVVVGYATQRKREMTGAVSVITSNSKKDTTTIQPSGGMENLITSIKERWEREKWDINQLSGNILCEIKLKEDGKVIQAKFPNLRDRRTKKRLETLLINGSIWLLANQPTSGTYIVTLRF